MSSVAEQKKRKAEPESLEIAAGRALIRQCFESGDPQMIKMLAQEGLPAVLQHPEVMTGVAKRALALEKLPDSIARDPDFKTVVLVGEDEDGLRESTALGIVPFSALPAWLGMCLDMLQKCINSGMAAEKMTSDPTRMNSKFGGMLLCLGEKEELLNIFADVLNHCFGYGVFCRVQAVIGVEEETLMDGYDDFTGPSRRWFEECDQEALKEQLVEKFEQAVDMEMSDLQHLEKIVKDAHTRWSTMAVMPTPSFTLQFDFRNWD